MTEIEQNNYSIQTRSYIMKITYNLLIRWLFSSMQKNDTGSFSVDIPLELLHANAVLNV